MTAYLLTPAKHSQLVDALEIARTTAMNNVMAARIPECGDFAAIAQNLDWSVATLKAMKPQGWQPIEAAPKDGTYILGMYMYIDTQIIHNIFWLDDEHEPEDCGWWTYEHSEVSRMKLEGWMTPTHWMPLPDGPMEIKT